MLQSTPRVKQSGAQGVRKLTLRELFDTEETPLLRYAFSITGRRAVAEEIVQEVFLQLHKHWDLVNEPRAWLFRSVRNKAYSHIRDSKREQIGGDDHQWQSQVSQPRSQCNEGESPDQILQAVEDACVLRQAMEQLSETDRQLVQLKYFEGLKYRDISEKTGLSVSNVGYRLHHVLKELERRLKPQGIDERP